MSLLNRKTLFVHINKSCGGIITDNFSKNGITELTGFHRTLIDLLMESEKLGLKSEDLFIFTIVRNPWERMLSLYLFYKYKFFRKEFFSGNPDIDDDFNKWIKYIYSKDFDRSRIHSKVNVFKYCFSNQLNWVKDENGQLIKNINIFKKEELDYEDLFENILKLQNFDSKTIIHPTNHSHYSNYYNEESKELIRKYYTEDIDYFGYKFEII